MPTTNTTALEALKTAKDEIARGNFRKVFSNINKAITALESSAPSAAVRELPLVAECPCCGTNLTRADAAPTAPAPSAARERAAPRVQDGQACCRQCSYVLSSARSRCPDCGAKNA